MSQVNSSYEVNMERKAYEIAKKAHEGQLDKGDKPYIEHVLKVADSFQDNYEARIVALLHDVIEDSSYTYDDIEREGFTENILKALRVITKEDDMDYMSYIKKVYSNELARMVKIEDLKHNMDLSIIPNPTDADYTRVNKYKNALVYLKKTNGEDKQ